MAHDMKKTDELPLPPLVKKKANPEIVVLKDYRKKG
jgi:hypothetical protein